MFEMERAIQARMEGCEDKDGVLETIKLNRLKHQQSVNLAWQSLEQSFLSQEIMAKIMSLC